MTRYSLRVQPGYRRFKPFFENMPQWFDGKGTVLHAKRNVVKAVRLADGTPVVVKRYCVPHLVPRLCYTFGRRSKARRAYDFALRLHDLGVDTPAPVACLEERTCGLFGLSYFVCRRDDRPSLNVLYTLEGSERETLIDAFADFLVCLHGKGFLHGDPNLSNILYEQRPDGTVRFSVIDINRSRFCRQPSRKTCLRNLVRVTHNRELMGAIVGSYARRRGWDEQESVQWVALRLTHFEQRKRAKHALRKR